MGILESTNDEAKSTAENLISEAVGLYNHMISVYSNGIYRFWKNPSSSPQEIATALGDRGKELFMLHYQLGQLLNSVNQGSIDSVNSNIGNFTFDQNNNIVISE